MSSRRVAGLSFGFVARVTLAAVIGILVLKWVVNKTGPAGLQRAVNAV